MKDRNHKNESGYTLISVAISLIIIGLVIAGFSQVYGIQKQKDAHILNETRISDIILKIQSYRQLYGRLPCPASINAARNSAAYGIESNCADTTSIPTGSCSGGICVINGARTITPVSSPAYTPRVRIGAIPFRMLQADEKDVTDAYNNRILYAVTEDLAVATTYSEINGGINIINENGDTIINPMGSANFLVVSAGPNKIGAFTDQGIQTSPCSGTGLDIQNCIDLTSPPATAVFVSSISSLASNSNEFDDTIDYFAALPDSRWKRTEGNPNNIESIVLNNVSAGISSTPTDKLHIAQSAARAATYSTGSPPAMTTSSTWDGALRATGNVQADKFCDETGSKCFDITDISGSNPSMTCSTSGEYMIGIEGDPTNPGHIRAKCSPVRIFCTNNSQPIFDGILSSGAPKCKSLSVNCGQANVQICNNSYTAFDIKNSDSPSITNPTSTSSVTYASGSYQWVTDPGAYTHNPARAQFQCLNGVWKGSSSSSWRAGLCNCNPTPPPSSTCSTTPLSPSCTASVPCTGSGTGSALTTYSFNYPYCVWVPSSTNYASCSCPSTPPSPAPAPTACVGTGYNSGWAIPGYTWNPSPSVCNWQANPSTCTCTAPSPSTRDRAPVQCNTLSGFSGHTGTAIPKETFNSTVGICQWQFSHYDTSGCTCDSTTEHISTNLHPTTCTTCENETAPAIWKYKFDGPGCSRGPDTLATPSTCVAKSFFWRLNTSGYSTFGASSKGGNPEVNSQTSDCDCVAWGSSKQSVCAAPATGSTWNIGRCTCRE